MDTVKRYLKQPSTWHGITILASVFGYAIAPGAIEVICAGALAVMGVIETVRDGDKKPGEPG